MFHAAVSSGKAPEHLLCVRIPRQTTDQQDHDMEPIVETCFVTAMGLRW
jgi:hypothetical protein